MFPFFIFGFGFGTISTTAITHAIHAIAAAAAGGVTLANTTATFDRHIVYHSSLVIFFRVGSVVRKVTVKKENTGVG